MLELPKQTRFDLIIPVEDWDLDLAFIDGSNDDAAIEIDTARAQIYDLDGALLFDLTEGDGITVNGNIVTLEISFADIDAYNTSVANVDTTAQWDMLVRRAVDSKLKRWFYGAVSLPKKLTTSIS